MAGNRERLPVAEGQARQGAVDFSPLAVLAASGRYSEGWNRRVQERTQWLLPDPKEIVAPRLFEGMLGHDGLAAGGITGHRGGHWDIVPWRKVAPTPV